MINYYFYALLYSPIVIFVFIFILLLRDNRIHCHIINRNHEVRRKKVNPNLEYFHDRNSIYMIPSDSVTLSSTVKGLNPKSELYYVEDNPLPINYTAPKDTEGKEVDAKVWITNKITLEMVLENTGKPNSQFLRFLFGYLNEPSKLMYLVIIIILVSAIAAPKYAPELLRGLPK